MYGKIIRLFLLEGNTNSLVTVELSNWTGIGIRVPKIKIKEYSSRPEFQKQGVYILVGKGESNEDTAYIGEAEIVYDRLLSHIANKEFWIEVVFFCNKDKYLNKASIKYLENRMQELATKAGRYKIDQNIPTRSELSEAEQAELEEFLSNIKILTSSLGHKIFEALEETISKNVQKENAQVNTDTESHIFYCRNSSGLIAAGSTYTEDFIVYKDSFFMIEDQQSVPESIRIEKQNMLSNGYFINENNFLKLTRDYVFNSPSRAACMILARSANGLTEWKTDKGITLKQMQV